MQPWPNPIRTANHLAFANVLSAFPFNIAFSQVRALISTRGGRHRQKQNTTNVLIYVATKRSFLTLNCEPCNCCSFLPQFSTSIPLLMPDPGGADDLVELN